MRPAGRAIRSWRLHAVVLVTLGLSGAVPAAGTAHRSSVAAPAKRTFAHLWIDGNGGSCTRSSRPQPYRDSSACGSPAAAYSRANATAAASRILIKGGTYSGFAISGHRSSRNRIAFAPAWRETAVFAGINIEGASGARGPDYVTLTNLHTARLGSAYANPDNRYGIYVGPGSTHIRLERMRAGNFLIQGAQHISVVGGDFGPCRAAETSQPCEINKVDHTASHAPSNIVVDGVHFHDYDLGRSCFSVSAGGTSTGNPDCHWRAMYINGVHNFTLRNSTFRDSFIAPWTTISGPAAAQSGNKNILIENNVFGTGVNYGSRGNYNNRQYGRWESFDLAWCQNVRGGVYAYDNVTYRFNSGSRSAGVFILFNQSGCAGKVRNVRVYGNIGLRNGCDPLVEYGYNVYSNRGRCHPSDRSVGRSALPFYRRDTHAPGRSDFALAGRRSLADRRVPVAAGCPARDIRGKRRPRSGFCDAGAYER